MIWSLATSNNIHRMTNWHNVGLGNQHFSPLQPISQITLESISAEALLSQADYALSNSFDEKAQVSLERTCYILLYHMDLFARRLSEKNAALKVSQTKSAEYAVSMREHFSLQASKEVFVQLNSLVALCIELYKTKTTPLFKYALLVTLRTLRLNIERVLMSKIELAEFGLGKGKSDP
jgi:6-pyruvoyl-tetrahydropterin synthase